jgi:hypothetical protein
MDARALCVIQVEEVEHTSSTCSSSMTGIKRDCTTNLKVSCLHSVQKEEETVCLVGKRIHSFALLLDYCLHLQKSFETCSGCQVRPSWPRGLGRSGPHRRGEVDGSVLEAGLVRNLEDRDPG